MSQLVYGGVALSMISTQSIEHEPQYSDDESDYLRTKITVNVVALVNAALSPSYYGESATATMARIRHLLLMPRRPLIFAVGNEILLASPTGNAGVLRLAAPVGVADVAIQVVSSDGVPGTPFTLVIDQEMMTVTGVSGGTLTVERGVIGVATLHASGSPALWTFGDGRDVNNGPRPNRCTIKQIVGSTTFIVEYSVSTWLIECPNSGAPNYVSHRFQDEAVIDDRFFTTRTRTGKIIARADLLTNADSLRGIAAYGTLLPGFRRERSQYLLSENGLELRYTFVDREVYLQAPAPAVKAEGTYTESTPNGAMRFAECNVRLYGAKTSDKGALIQLAILIALTKVRNQGEILGTPQSKTLLASAAIRTDLYENACEVTIKTNISATPLRTQNVPMDLRRFTDPPIGSNPQIDGVLAPDPGTRGTAGLQFIAAALQDPCLQSTVSTLTNQAPSTSTLSTQPPPAQVSVMETMPTDTAGKYRDTASGGIFTDYKLQTEYGLRSNSRVLPLATGNPQYAGHGKISLGPPSLKKIVSWTAEKQGGRPALPDPQPTDPNISLLGAKILMDATEPSGDGVSLIYRRAGEFIYGFLDNTKATLDGGLLPWASPDVAQEAGISVDEFDTEVLTPGSSTPGVAPFSNLDDGWD